MTTSTPESRGRIAYTAYLRKQYAGQPIPATEPTFDRLSATDQASWIDSARVIWELATTGLTAL